MIVFEGVDCSGKTTAINYIKDKLISNGINTVALSDWASDPLGKQRLMAASTTEEQVKIVLECRRNTHKILSDIPKNTVVLFDRYVLSTLVYQCFSFKELREVKPRLNVSQELLAEVVSTQIPHTQVYIQLAEGFDRAKFLKKRGTKDKFDRRDCYWDSKVYWYIRTFPGTLGLTMPKMYLIHNNGTNDFFKELDSLADKLLADLSSKTELQNVTAN